MPMLLTKLMGSGMSSGLVEALGGDAADSLTATGTNQATAYETRTAISRFTTVASGTGALLDNGARGDSQYIVNAGANTLLVYPPIGHTINGLSANAAFSLAAGSWAHFDRITDGRWVAGSDDSANASFMQSGTGAIAESVQDALRRLVHTAQYSTTANFNTANLALTGSIGFPRLVMPTINNPSATFSFKSYDGTGQDTSQWGYNLSTTLYVPNDLTEPQLWFGLESNFANSEARDPAFGTEPTSEAYLRFTPIGSSTTSEYLEALFFSFARTSNKIIRADIRAEHISLQNTNDGSVTTKLEITPTTTTITNTTINMSGLSLGASAAAMSRDLTITGTATGVALWVDDADAIQLIRSTTGTNRARLRLLNTSGNLEIGTDNSAGNGFFEGGGGQPYASVICNQQSGTLTLIGHSTPTIYITNDGNVGIKTGSFGTSAVGVFAVKNGTAPSDSPADTVQFYSSDDTGGNTIPSFFCEGSGVVATAQADSASSVRVKMRINGTVRTFLCI